MSLKRRAWLTVGAVVLAGGGVVTYAVASPSTDGPGVPNQQKRPAKVFGLPLTGSQSGKKELPKTDTQQFSLVGVTWSGARAQLDGKAQVRTHSVETGEWSSWRDLDVDVDPVENPEPEMRGGSEPLWVGPSDGVEAQVVHEDGTTGALPKGLTVTLVDPGVVTKAEQQAASEPAGFAADPAAFAAEDPTPTATEGTTSESPAPASTDTGESPAPTTDPATTDPAPTSAAPTTTASASPAPSTSASATASPSASAAVTGPPSTVPRPPIVSRAGWGADESLSPDPNDLNDDVKAVFVHHTDGADYDCADSASIVRGIYAYHTAAPPKGQGWNDIGYNFLVDKCGTIFEGRKGGVDLPILGAHTYGWNRESTGVAVLGNYVSASASKAALTSVARIAAWKLGQYGADPNSTVKLKAGDSQKNLAGTSFTAGTSYTFNRISGHRDGYATECPGDGLYKQLPTIRAWASGPVQGLTISSLAGTRASGSTYYTKGSVTAHWTATTPSSLIKQFQVLVDGKVAATTSGTATSAAVTLGVGSHTVAVRAVHQSGKTATTAAKTVVADTTLPTFTTAPKVTLRKATVNTTAVPVTLGWKATDDKALYQVKLTAPTAVTFAGTTTSSSRTVKSGAATTWSMQAIDYAGNIRTASSSATPVILQETSATRSGTWSTKSSSSYLGGKSYTSSSKGASLTWTFTGRSAAWVVSRASGSGQAYVYVDGVKTSTVDLKSSSTLYRQAIWTKNWSSSAKHTIKIVVVGTSGRPTITTDGLVYIK